MGVVEKVVFNWRARKVIAKHAKLKPADLSLCDLCEFPWRTLRFMNLNFLDTP
jgi:hypothetical protein